MFSSLETRLFSTSSACMYFRTLAIALVATLLAGGTSGADDYPTRPVRIVAADGPLDGVDVGQHIGQHLDSRSAQHWTDQGA